MVNINSNNTTVSNQSVGKNSTVINGHNNAITENFYNYKTITPSDIYEVCEILDGNLSDSDSLEYSLNPDWLYKMEYNSLCLYKEKFEEYCMFYESVETVFRSSTFNGTRLLRRINTIYIEIATTDDQLNSDQIIQHIINNLREIVKDSYENTTLTSEHIEDVIISVVFFAFTRCKILKKPPRIEILLKGQ